MNEHEKLSVAERTLSDAVILALKASAEVQDEALHTYELSPEDETMLARLHATPVKDLIAEHLRREGQVPAVNPPTLVELLRNAAASAHEWWNRSIALGELPALMPAFGLGSETSTEEANIRVLRLRDWIPIEVLESTLSWTGDNLKIFRAPDPKHPGRSLFTVDLENAPRRNVGMKSLRVTLVAEGKLTPVVLTPARFCKTLIGSWPTEWEELQLQLNVE